MTDALWLFLVGLLTSLVGSIPPGTLNLTVLQLGIEGKTKIAWRFALAVTLIEYPYTWLAIQFESWITSNSMVAQHFQLITAIVVTVLGIASLIAARKPSRFTERIESSGFRRGLVLSILNPIAIPWWTGVIAYQKAQGWITLTSSVAIHSYVFGTAAGVFILLGLFILLSERLAGYANQNTWVKILPSLLLLGLGLIAFWNYFVSAI